MGGRVKLRHRILYLVQGTSLSPQYTVAIVIAVSLKLYVTQANHALRLMDTKSVIPVHVRHDAHNANGAVHVLTHLVFSQARRRAEPRNVSRMKDNLFK